MSDVNFYTLEVLDNQTLTDDADCISLVIPDSLKETFHFTQGQYLTFKANINGEEVRRSYSICSAVGDAEREGIVKVGIKRIDGGVFSNYACDYLVKGATVEVMPPQGNFYTEVKKGQKKHYMLLAVGSGITPVLSILKTILATETESTVTLIYGNRRSSTIMFKEELGFLKNRYLTRFTWLNVLSKEEQDAEVLYGRIDNKKGADLAAKGLIDIPNTDEFFLCGPESMISSVSRALRAQEISEDNIHYELFFTSAEDAQDAIDKHHARAEKYADKSCDVSVKVDGRAINFNLAANGENILDAAITHGADLPYSCKAGVCATCKCKVLEGEVEMDLNHSLTDKEVANGMILSCQAHPVSDSLVIDFDLKN
jgi:ring-1,2-phenylacetyl-CoA epoxidase subunit PaaE